jgi:hypothetical protein
MEELCENIYFFITSFLKIIYNQIYKEHIVLKKKNRLKEEHSRLEKLDNMFLHERSFRKKRRKKLAFDDQYPAERNRIDAKKLLESNKMYNICKINYFFFCKKNPNMKDNECYNNLLYLFFLGNLPVNFFSYTNNKVLQMIKNPNHKFWKLRKIFVYQVIQILKIIWNKKQPMLRMFDELNIKHQVFVNHGKNSIYYYDKKTIIQNALKCLSDEQIIQIIKKWTETKTHDQQIFYITMLDLLPKYPKVLIEIIQNYL